MYRGIKQVTSLVALVAAAGILSTHANAADLGGDCCADLEERVAELEATTARKGNRKVSLTISGQVSKSIVHFNDGKSSNTILGVDNVNSSTRFNFGGEGKISPSLKAGYNLMIEVASGGRTSNISQGNEDNFAFGNLSSVGGANNIGQLSVQNQNANGRNDHVIQMRDANFWLESSSVGRATLGRLTNTAPTGVIDLGGVSIVASAAMDLVGSNLSFRSKNSGFTTDAILANQTHGGADWAYRIDGIRYSSPTFAGFTFNASVGEALKVQTLLPGDPRNSVVNMGRVWGANALYAGEFQGIRVAASAGYERAQRDEMYGIAAAPPTGQGPSPTQYSDGAVSPGQLVPGDVKNYGYAMSLLHTPTGLFLQGDWKGTERNRYSATLGEGPAGKGSNWMIQAGISQNFFGVGKTNLYGEYGRANGMNQAFQAVNQNGAGTAWVDPSAGASNLEANKVTMLGLGVVQNIDAASMELFLGWRRFSLSGQAAEVYAVTGITPGAVAGAGGCGAATGAAGSAGSFVTGQCRRSVTSFDSVDIIHAGGRIKF